MKDGYRFPYIKKEGSLCTGSSNRAGKNFAKWSYKPVNSERFEINVSVLYATQKKPLRFSATSPHLSQSYENSDIEKLRQMVESDLDVSCKLLNEIDWKEWYEVTVSGENSDRRGMDANLSISYGKLKRGINPDTGEAVTIHNNSVIIKFPSPKKHGVFDDDFFSSFGSKEEVSYIPATEKNTAALESLTTKLGMLRGEISQLLSQDRIEKSLGSINVNNLLEHKEKTNE